MENGDDYFKSQLINIFGILISFISVAVAIYFQFQDPMTGIVWVLGILGFVALYFIVSYVVVSIIGKFNQIKNNTILIHKIEKDLNTLNNRINIITDIANLNARLSFLEKRKK